MRGIIVLSVLFTIIYLVLGGLGIGKLGDNISENGLKHYAEELWYGSGNTPE